MNRRDFFSSSTQAALLGAASIAIAHPLEAADEKGVELDFTFLCPPVLVQLGEGRVRVLIRVSGLATGKLLYGNDEKLTHETVTLAQGFHPLEEKVLAFDLNDLNPGEEHFYKIVATAVDYGKGQKAMLGKSIETLIEKFTAINSRGETAKITFWNDTHQNEATVRQLFAKAEAEPADLLIWNGDVTNDILNEEILYGQYLSPYGLPIASRRPMMLSRGNHDVRGRYSRELSRFYGDNDGNYHRILRVGPLGIVMLDTGEDKLDENIVYAGLNNFTALREKEARWLEQAIENPEFKEAKFKIAVMHIPLRWDKDVPENWWKVWGGFKGWVCEEGQKLWHDSLVRADVKFIVSGHTHNPAWFPGNADLPYGQVIGGGPKLEMATRTLVDATEQKLTFKVINMSDEVLFEHSFNA